MTYADPHSIFSFCEADSGLQTPRQSRRCVFAPGSSSVLWSSFSVPPAVSCKEVKGWRRFHDRGRLGVVCPTWRPRSLMSAKREPGVHGAQVSPTEDPRKRQADRSDVRQEFARFKRARTGFEPMA